MLLVSLMFCFFFFLFLATDKGEGVWEWGRRVENVFSLFSAKEPPFRAAVPLPCLQNAWKWLKTVVNINISLCIKSASLLAYKCLGKGCPALQAVPSTVQVLAPALSACRWREKQGALEMGEVGRGAVKAIGKRKGEEISGFPVPLDFFLISVLHSSLKTWEVKAAHLQRMNEQKGEKQNREKCVENRADEKAGTCHKIPQHFIFVVTCKWPSEVVRGY